MYERSVTSPVLQRPVLTVPPGRAAGWHQRIGMCETLPAPKCVAFRKDLPQPLWELRLNPDYGTLPGVPLLEALQSVGVLGADVPAYLDRAMSMNIYVSSSPATLLRDAKVLDIPAEMDLVFFFGYLITRTCFSGRRWETLTTKSGSKVPTSGRCR